MGGGWKLSFPSQEILQLVLMPPAVEVSPTRKIPSLLILQLLTERSEILGSSEMPMKHSLSECEMLFRSGLNQNV